MVSDMTTKARKNVLMPRSNIASVVGTSGNVMKKIAKRIRTQRRIQRRKSVEWAASSE